MAICKSRRIARLFYSGHTIQFSLEVTAHFRQRAIKFRISGFMQQHRRRLTLRSRRGPTAGHQARAGGTRYIFTSPALASHRRSRLNSNVRQHQKNLSSVRADFSVHSNIASAQEASPHLTCAENLFVISASRRAESAGLSGSRDDEDGNHGTPPLCSDETPHSVANTTRLSSVGLRSQ